MIMAGTKTWEMRPKRSSYTGRVGLIKKGTGLVVGVVDLVASLPPLDAASLAEARDRHGIPPEEDAEVLRNRWLHPWVLANVRPLIRPVRADQISGQVTWVTLSQPVIAAIDEQLAGSGKPATIRLPSSTEPPLQRKKPVIRTPSADRRPPSAVVEARVPGGGEMTVELTAGAIKNGNICVRDGVSWLPSEVLGGSNKTMAANALLTVIFSPGETVETDIAGDKMLLRCRGAVKDFFNRSGAMPGDAVRIRQRGRHTLHVELER